MNYHNFILGYLAVAKTLARLTGGSYSPYQGGIPVILPSSGSIGDNGALTGLTSLPATITSCFMYFPADAIEAGSAAGLYYVVMSSTTAGAIYNNTYTSGKPEAPASPTPFTTTGPGAYTQTTGSDIALVTFTLPGGSLGKNGSLYVYPHFAVSGTANIKSLRVKAGAVNIGSTSSASAFQSTMPSHMRNAGAENRNICSVNSGLSASSSNAATFSSIDTAADVTMSVTAQLATATDFAGLLGALALVYPTN